MSHFSAGANGCGGRLQLTYLGELMLRVARLTFWSTKDATGNAWAAARSGRIGGVRFAAPCGYRLSVSLLTLKLPNKAHRASSAADGRP